jgi:hypothetical protein
MFNLMTAMRVPFSVFCVLFVCKCVACYCLRVSSQLQLNIYIISITDLFLHTLSLDRSVSSVCIVKSLSFERHRI